MPTSEQGLYIFHCRQIRRSISSFQHTDLQPEDCCMSYISHKRRLYAFKLSLQAIRWCSTHQAKLQLTVVLFLILLNSIPRFALNGVVWSPIIRGNVTVTTVTELPYANTSTGGYVYGDGGIDDRSTTGGCADSQHSIEWELVYYQTSFGLSWTFWIV